MKIMIEIIQLPSTAAHNQNLKLTALNQLIELIIILDISRPNLPNFHNNQRNFPAINTTFISHRSWHNIPFPTLRNFLNSQRFP